jgi:hypothetical protein
MGLLAQIGSGLPTLDRPFEISNRLEFGNGNNNKRKPENTGEPKTSKSFRRYDMLLKVGVYICHKNLSCSCLTTFLHNKISMVYARLFFVTSCENKMWKNVV